MGVGIVTRQSRLLRTKGVARGGGSRGSHEPPFAIVCCAHALIADDAGSD